MRSVVKHLAVVLAVLGASPAMAGEVVWQIGVTDRSYRELAIAGRYPDYPSVFPADVRFRVGTDKPEAAWPFIQPGPDDAWAGSRMHPFVVEFDLGAAPAGSYRLVIDLLNSHYSGPPVVEVAVNGKAKLRLRTPAGVGDASLSDPAVNRPTTLSMVFAAANLQAGTNRISITPVSGSWMLYDSLRLESGSDIPTTPQVANLSAASTCLFKYEGSKLKQAMRVGFNNVGTDGAARFRVTGGISLDRQVQVAPGANQIDLLVDPATKVTKARVTVEAGGKSESADVEMRPERRWKVFVAPSVHTDIGYTDIQEKTIQRHVENNLAALKACASDPLFRWNFEVAGQAEILRERYPAEYARMVDLARAGRVGVQGLYLNMLTGLCSGEELVRAIGIGQEIGDRDRIPVVAAALTDVPSAVGTLPMILRGSGVRYFAEGINQDRGPVFKWADRRMHQSPFWWEALDGSRVLATFAFGYAQASGLGMNGTVETVAQALPGWLRQFDRPDYPSDAVLAYGGFSDNELMRPRFAQVAGEWGKQWDFPKIVVGRLDEYFQYVEARDGKSLPVFRGDMGSYWEDGAGSSALETALNRWSVTRLGAAQTRLALHDAEAPLPERVDTTLASAWRGALYYDEHTWGAAGSIADPQGAMTLAQWAVKAQFAVDAAQDVDSLADMAFAASLPGRPIGVRNDLAWSRDIVASVPAGAAPAEGGQKVGDRRLVLATNVPALGVARFDRGAAVGSSSRLVAAGPNRWRTPTCAFTVDPKSGAISSLVDQRGREWVNAGSGRMLNEFVYALGGEGTGLVYGSGAPPKTVPTVGHTSATVELVEAGPVRSTLRIHRTGPDAPTVDTYLIADARGDLQFLNVIRKQATTRKEGGYFAFPFRLDKPQECRTLIELPYGIVEAEKEQPKGACREWYSAHGFVAVTDGRATAYLATPHAPLLTVGDIFRGLWKGKVDGTPGTVYGYVLNNYWHTNYKASQGGSLVFSYTLRMREGPFDPVAATKFGWEKRAEMIDPRLGDRDDIWTLAADEATPVIDAQPAPRVTGGRALLTAARWRDGRLLLRLYNPTGVATMARLDLSKLRVQSAESTDLVGRLKGRLALGDGGRSVAVAVRARGLSTVALRTR